VVAVSHGGHGRPPKLSLTGGLLAPRLVGSWPGVAHVALVATTATLLGGDDVRLRIHVGGGVRLELEDVAATVAYAGRGRTAQWSVMVSVEPEATLVWRTEPFVVSDGACVVRHLDVDVAAGGRVLMRDVLVLGRHGERGGDLRCRTAVGYDGAPLLVEDLDLANGPKGLGGVGGSGGAVGGALDGDLSGSDPALLGRAGQFDAVVDVGALRHQPGVLGPFRVAETITRVGEPVPQFVPIDPDAAVLMHLPGPGLLVRSLASHTHASQLDAGWADLADHVRSA
jgi:urease accessory protein